MKATRAQRAKARAEEKQAKSKADAKKKRAAEKQSKWRKAKVKEKQAEAKEKRAAKKRMGIRRGKEQERKAEKTARKFKDKLAGADESLLKVNQEKINKKMLKEIDERKQKEKEKEKEEETTTEERGRKRDMRDEQVKKELERFNKDKERTKKDERKRQEIREKRKSKKDKTETTDYATCEQTTMRMTGGATYRELTTGLPSCLDIFGTYSSFCPRVLDSHRARARAHRGAPWRQRASEDRKHSPRTPPALRPIEQQRIEGMQLCGGRVRGASTPPGGSWHWSL